MQSRQLLDEWMVPLSTLKRYGKFWREVKVTNAELGMVILFLSWFFYNEKNETCTMIGLKEFVLSDQWLEHWNVICKHKLWLSSSFFPSNELIYCKDQMIFISGLGLGVLLLDLAMIYWKLLRSWILVYLFCNLGFSKCTSSVDHVFHETVLLLAHEITLFWKF